MNQYIRSESKAREKADPLLNEGRALVAKSIGRAEALLTALFAALFPTLPSGMASP